MKAYVGRYPNDPSKERKIRVRIDPWDTWSMDATLVPIILPMLKQLKESKHGSSGSMLGFNQCSYASIQHCFEFYKDGDEEADKAGHAQWEGIMEKMIWSFEQLDTDWEDQFHSGEHDILWEPVPGTELTEMKRGPNDTHKFDADGYMAHLERIREGLRLFGEYYMDLWD
jgi:hypothetical protein